MGTGSVYQERGKWVAQVSIGPRSQRRFVRRTRATRRDALAALTELRNSSSMQPSSRLTLGVYLTRWVSDVRNLRPATRHAYANAIRYHLAPTIGEIRLSELNPIYVEHMLSVVGERVGPKTLRNVHAVLRRALAMAVRAGLVTRNVAAREFVDAPRVPAQEPRALSGDEVRRLLAACKGDRLEALFITAVATGLRQGELLGLAWEDLEFGEDHERAKSRGTVRAESGRDGVGVRPSTEIPAPATQPEGQTLRGEVSGPERVGVRRLSDLATQPRLSVRRELVHLNGRYQRVELKTPQSRRAVPLTPSVVDALRAHRERVIAAGFVPTATGPVFTTPKGTALSGSWLTHRFYRLCDAAGIPRLAFHRLRATYASRLAEAGVSEMHVARLLGHARTYTSKQHYIALNDVPQVALDSIEEMLG